MYRTILSALIVRGNQTSDEIFNTLVMNGTTAPSRQEIRTTCDDLYNQGVVTCEETIENEKWYSNRKCRYTISLDYLLEPFETPQPPPRDPAPDCILDLYDWADELPNFNQDIGEDWRPGRLYQDTFNNRRTPPPVPSREGRPPLSTRQ